MTTDKNTTPQRGKLIVLEGIDGAGTTTQSKLLAVYLQLAGIPVLNTCLPSKRPIGLFTRRFLKSDHELFDASSPAADMLACLFAADRYDLQKHEILPALKSGTTVICDRYMHSSVFYQTAETGDLHTIKWIKAINRNLIKADLIFYLKIDAATGAQRRAERGDENERYDTTEFQEKLVALYDNFYYVFPSEPVITIDGSLPIDEVATHIGGLCLGTLFNNDVTIRDNT